jgi:hypothetical protein
MLSGRMAVYNSEGIFKCYMKRKKKKLHIGDQTKPCCCKPKFGGIVAHTLLKKIKFTLILKLLVFCRYFEFLRTTPSDL